jgi:AcrR family transcriptional regulator
MPARLGRITTAASAGGVARHEPAQQLVLVTQASSGARGTEPPSLRRGGGDATLASQGDSTSIKTASGTAASAFTGLDSGAADAGPTMSLNKVLAPKRRSGRPRRGRPRNKNADKRILIAAAEVMAEKGIGGLSIEEVASRAGVGKTTIYRRWSSRGTLALDAFLDEFGEQPGLPDTGTFAGDLREALGAWVIAVAGTNAGAMLVGLLAEIQQDRTLAAAWQDRVIAPLRAQYSIMLDHGVSRGEIPADTDAGIVLDLVFGACYYRLLLHGQHGHRPLNEQFVNQVVAVVAAGVGAHAGLPVPWSDTSWSDTRRSIAPSSNARWPAAVSLRRSENVISSGIMVPPRP